MVEIPSLGHIIYGFSIIIPILYFFKGKEEHFNYKIAFIFLANNFLGPDAAQIFVGLPFHSIFGYLIFAIPLALLYSYFSRFTLIRKAKWFDWEDEGIREVNFKNAYCLSVAGGISHFFIDQFYHWEKNMILWPDVYIHHDEMLAWGGPKYHVVDPVMGIGYAIIITAIFLSYYTFKKGYKESFELFFFTTIISIILMFALGIEVYGGEREFGVIVHSVVYVLIPFFLLFYAAKDVGENPVTTPCVPKIARKRLLRIIAVISIIFSVAWIAISILAIMNPEIIATPLAIELEEFVWDVASAIRIIGIVVLFAFSALLVGSIGLLFKNNICRYIVISLFTVLFILALPFALALFLNEKDVKVMFEK